MTHKITINLPDDVYNALMSSFEFDQEAYKIHHNKGWASFEQMIIKILEDWGSFYDKNENLAEALEHIVKTINATIRDLREEDVE